MTAKKAADPIEPEIPGVNMDHIKEIMGPLPNEHPLASEYKKQKNAIDESEENDDKTLDKDETVASAAEEANATLKALSPDMGEATITKVDDDETEEGEEVEEDTGISPELFGTPTDEVDASEEESSEEKEPIEGEGVVADDPATIKAVEDIVKHEGDEVLEAEDEKHEDEVIKSVPKVSFKDKIRNLWSKKAFRRTLIAFVLLVIAAVAVVPTTRYFVLNSAGVRASMSVSVIDGSTLQPLKNVQVTAAGVTAQTDSKGKARLEHIKLGPTTLSVTKRAFSTVSQSVTIGWGSNPEGQVSLKATGSQYTFVITDFLTAKPIEKVEASSGEGSALSNKDGKIVLSLDTSGKSDTEELEFQIGANGYRTETVKLSASNKETTAVKMVSAQKDVFVSKRSGNYDIYTIDIDGKNEKKIVAGTGLEREDLTLAPQQNSDIAAFVATRENARDSDGYLLSTLYFVDTKQGTLTKVDQSQQIQLIGWSKDQRLVYIKIAAGTSGANPKRHRLVSVNAKNSSDSKELASSNYFNDAVMSGDTVLYAPSNSFQENPHPGLFSVRADGTGQFTVTDKEVYNVFRLDYETVGISTNGATYTYKIGAAPSTLSTEATASQINRLYVDNTVLNRSLWVDDRDGKKLLLSYDKTTKKDTTLLTKTGIKQPVYWLNDTTVIFRVNDGKETADYVMSTVGGEAKKIQDVTDVFGIGRWYYY